MAPTSLSSVKQGQQRAQSVPPSLKIRNIKDPDRIDEYHRQRELELQAMRRKEEEAIFWADKQVVSNRYFHSFAMILC